MYKGVWVVNLKNITAREVHDYIIHGKDINDDEWLEISKWINEFLKSNPPLEEKKMFVPLGCAEIVSIMCDGIIRWRNSICIKCKKQKGNAECHCEIYPENEEHTGIPNEIWAREDAQCPYFEEES